MGGSRNWIDHTAHRYRAVVKCGSESRRKLPGLCACVRGVTHHDREVAGCVIQAKIVSAQPNL